VGYVGCPDALPRLRTDALRRGWRTPPTNRLAWVADSRPPRIHRSNRIRGAQWHRARNDVDRDSRSSRRRVRALPTRSKTSSVCAQFSSKWFATRRRLAST
jgi:hypothetical protein